MTLSVMRGASGMRAWRWSTVLAVVLVWQLMSGAEAVKVNDQQRQAMLDVGTTLSYLNWSSANLNTLDCIQLTGVLACSADGWVESLTVYHTRGAFPNQIAQFEKLKVLNVINSFGPFPSFLADMPSLVELVFTTGTMTGSLPNNWSAASNLVLLAVTDQAISGYLPTHLPPSIRAFSLAGNRGILEGQIPSIYPSLPTLITLVLPQSGLSGPVPFPTSPLYSSLQTYKIEARRTDAPAEFFLTGTLPDDLFDGPLVYLSFEDVAISGSFPTKEVPVGCLLRQFSIVDWKSHPEARTSFTGSIPPTLNRCTSLNEFNVRNANMNGSFPAELLTIPSLRILNLADNDFEGTLPTNWFPMNAMRHLNLANNNFHGPIPNTLGDVGRAGNLMTLYLQNNDFELCGDPVTTLGTAVPDRLSACNARGNEDTSLTCSCRTKWAGCVDVDPNCVSGTIPVASPQEDSFVPTFSSSPPTSLQEPQDDHSSPQSTPQSTPPPSPSSDPSPPSSSSSPPRVPTSEAPVSSAAITGASICTFFALLFCYLSF